MTRQFWGNLAHKWCLQGNAEPESPGNGCQGTPARQRACGRSPAGTARGGGTRTEQTAIHVSQAARSLPGVFLAMGSLGSGGFLPRDRWLGQRVGLMGNPGHQHVAIRVHRIHEVPTNPHDLGPAADVGVLLGKACRLSNISSESLVQPCPVDVPPAGGQGAGTRVGAGVQ